jgi:hypothetical protein
MRPLGYQPLHPVTGASPVTLRLNGQHITFARTTATSAEGTYLDCPDQPPAR